MKISPNASCPCHSGKKYKKCCAIYHKGLHPLSATLLMRSRYSAYALNLSDYIIRTTHPKHPDFSYNTTQWKKEIENFSTYEKFLGLTILSFYEEKDEAFVIFEAYLGSGIMVEKSRFLKENGIWLYQNGEVSLKGN